ncbi:MAG TPA: AsmA family protein, partial [Kiloniellales bacterium]|nr:AsmA family protein [Kiloniellales bacterium]
NLPDGSAPTMVELESLRIRVALLPLLGGDVQVERVSLVKPVILVEALADGRRNWEFVTRAAGASDAAAEDGAPVADGGLPGEFRLDSFTIEQGTVIYRDAVRGISERIEKLDAEIAAESLEGPFLIRGQARVRDAATRFDVSLGRLVEDGATPLNLGVTLSEARAKVQFGGALSLHGESSSLRGSFKAEGPDLAAAAAAVPGGPTLPPALAKSFALEADVSADSQSVSAAELIVRLGEIAAEGELQVALGPPPDVRLRLAATQINLDRLLASAAAEPGSEPGAGRDTGPGEGSGGAPEPAAAAGPPAGLPGDLTANVQLSVDALVYRDQVVRQALADLTLSEGRLEVGQALPLLPGGSDASLTGTLASADDGGHGLRFDGRAELASDNLRGMLEWLGADLSAVPPERLRKMSLTTRIGATAKQLTASEIDLRVDLSRATGGVVVALRERPGLGIGLSIDRVNLDA